MISLGKLHFVEPWPRAVASASRILCGFSTAGPASASAILRCRTIERQVPAARAGMSHWPQSAWLAAIVAALCRRWRSGSWRAVAHLPLAHPSRSIAPCRPVARVGGFAIWAGFLPDRAFVPVPMAGGVAWLAAWAAIAAVSSADDWRAVRPACGSAFMRWRRSWSPPRCRDRNPRGDRARRPRSRSRSRRWLSPGRPTSTTSWTAATASPR